ncbi:uncharacterized protein LOC128953828 [Oppia nitens]|uniref:uncharacterized protein LOC128953828 n=1 Tax=Oppia nitens TaxID=1686743 RepID=UPI0023DBCC8F|nr:uncharacterized protein LOC128953828 [Oppia nitens]
MSETDTADDSQREVLLYIYDMSKGMAKAFSQMFLGKELPGIWHTSVIAYDREYFFGSFGIESCNPGETVLGEPDQILSLGKCQLPYSLFLEYLFSLGDSSFAPVSYSLLDHNCNNFSNELSIFLTGRPIPQEIIDLPQEVLNTPIGQTLKLYLSSLSIRPEGTGVSFSGNVDNIPLESSEQNSNSVINRRKSSTESLPQTVSSVTTTQSTPRQPQTNCKMADNETDLVEEETPKETKTEETKSQRRSYKYDDPPVLFKDVNGVAAIKKITELITDLLSNEQQQYLKELSEYLVSESGAWALGDEHLEFIALLLSGGDGKFAPNVALLVLEVLQSAALKDDIVLVLHQDRKDHRLMSYINKIESLTLAEQEEVAKLLCNLCGQPTTFDWLLYISEWIESDGQSSSNSRTTTKAAVHTLLNDKLTTLQKTGVFLIYNLALKELFEDTATELATAVLQFLHGDLPEDQAFMCLTAIIRFIAISYNDVPALVKMLGPDINKFKGFSERVDKLVDELNIKLAALPSLSGE